VKLFFVASAALACGLLAGGVEAKEARSSDAERNNSSEMNASKDVCASVRADGGVRVLFLGNSITLHGPSAKIGWTNNWGMAASCAENDFVHIVTRGIEAKTGRRADVRVRNVADFERKFDTWKVSPEIQSLIDFNADYVVFAIGENTADLPTEAEQRIFRDAVKRFFALFARGRAKPHVVVRGVFWPSKWKDDCLAHAASDLAFTFVKADFGDLWGMDDWGRHWHSGVSRHPGDAGMAAIAGAILDGFFPKDSGYAAWVDGQPAEVRPILVSRQPFNQWAPGYQRPADQTETAGLLRFETDGPSSLAVRQTFQRSSGDLACVKVRPTTNILVRPLSAGVTPSVDKDGVISFTLPKPGFYVLEIDGYHRPLEIFAQPKRDFAAERKEANVFFGPGIHEPVVVKLKSHDRVYLDRDAVVYGSFQADGVEDVKVSGYGIICGERNRREGNACYREGMDGAVRIIDSKDVTFDGPTVLDSCCWCVSAFNSHDLAFRNLKVTGAWRYNTDGIDICNSQRVKVENCYVHSFDDALVVKGISHDYVEAKKSLSLAFVRNEPVEDVVFSNCVCWCGWGRTLEIGLETWARHFRGIAFEDCDLIHNGHGALSVHLGGPAVVEDVTFRDIRIECDGSEECPVMQTSREQKVTCRPGNRFYWLVVQNEKMFAKGSMYGTTYDFSKEPHGTIRKLTVDNVKIYRTNGAPGPVKGIDPQPGTSFGTIVVTNVVTDAMASVDIDRLCPPRPETAARYESGTYPEAVRPYRESALAVYHYMTSLPAMTSLVETGKPNQKYQHNAYVSKTHAAHVQAMLAWAKAEPSRRSDAMRFAKASAEFLLGELEPPDAPLAWWPPTYGRKPLEFDPNTDGPYKKPAMVGNEPEGAVKYRGEVMLVYPADVGQAFLGYYGATGDKRFLTAAVGIGETYLRTRRTDGCWPLKMKLATGETVGENTLVPDRVMLFFAALHGATGDVRWRQAEDAVFAWLEAHPLADWNWDGQFEDIKPEKPYLNPTKHNAIETMMYLLRRFPGDKARLATCRKILEFCEKRFVVWKAPANHPHWPAPSVLEQYSCFTPIDSSVSKMIRGYLAMYRAEGRTEDCEKAKALGNMLTRVQKPSGRIPTFWEGVYTGDSGLSDERYDWLNCMASSAWALTELSEFFRGMREVR